MPGRYAIAAPNVPADDRSGALGKRLLSLLTRQAERDLRWLAQEQKGRQGPPHDYRFMFFGTAQQEKYPWLIMHQVEDCALEFAVLARFGPEKTVSGVSRDELVEMALGFIRAVAQTHPVNGEVKGCRIAWDRFDALRHDFVLGLAAWLLWDKVDGPTQLLLARMLEHDADSWCKGPAPAKLYDDTQAESNAWSSSGMALAYCLLKNHPRRAVWGEKAQELMISAYATAADVASDRLVDGKPLNKWLTGPTIRPATSFRCCQALCAAPSSCGHSTASTRWRGSVRRSRWGGGWDIRSILACTGGRSRTTSFGGCSARAASRCPTIR